MTGGKSNVYENDQSKGLLLCGDTFISFSAYRAKRGLGSFLVKIQLKLRRAFRG